MGKVSGTTKKKSKSGHWRIVRKRTFCTQQWPKKHFQVAKSGFWGEFSSFYRTQVYLGSDLWVRVSLSEGGFWNYTSYRLYTSYTSYTSYRLYTEKVTRVAPSGGQFCNLCKWLNLLAKICNPCTWRHLEAKFGTNASGAIWWTILQLMQIAPSGGQICN